MTITRAVRIMFPLALASIAACTAWEETELATEQQAVALPPVSASSAVGTLDGTFNVTGDGAATYTVALDAPAGRAGIEPALALSYSSNGGNGLAGVGWGLSGFSQISRCGRTFWRDGEVRPMQFASTDNLCLDGARLVEVAQGPAIDAPACASPQAKTEYRTEPDSFAKIVACGVDASGPVQWLVYGKDGRIRRYGSTANGRLDVTVLVPDGNGNGSAPAVRRPGWLLDRVEDRVGNYLTFTYGRFNAPVPDKLEWWPERIDYTGHGATAPNRSVIFKYGFAAEDENPPRPDAWSSYLRGIEVMHTRILKSVTMTAPSPAEQALPFVRKYVLGYTSSAHSGRALLATLTVCDGLGACLPPTRFTYATAAAPTFARTTQGSAPAIARVDALSGTDVTGDGKDDLMYTQELNGVRSDFVRVAGGSTAFPAYGAAVTTSLPGDFPRTTRIPYETTGDGKVDLISDGCTATEVVCLDHDGDGVCHDEDVCSAYDGLLYQSDGAGHLDELIRQPLCSDPAHCGPIRTAADVNGDGEVDALRNQTVQLSFLAAAAAPLTLANPGRTYLSGPVKHADVDGDGTVDFLWPYTSGSARRYDALHVRGAAGAPHVEATALNLELTDNNCQIFADVNGDRLLDVVDIAVGAAVRLNRGDGRFDTAATWASSATGFAGAPICAQAAMPSAPWLGWKRAAVFPVDYNQDGLQDLLVLQPVSGFTSSARVLVSTGRAFTTVTLGGLNTGIGLDCATTGAAPAATTLDANGDGLFDVVFVCPDATTGTGGSFRLYTQQSGTVAGGRVDVLTRVTDGLGAIVRHVDYKLLTDPTVYTRTTAFVQPTPVVASESIDDGDGNLIETARHLYEGGTTTADTEGWLGFSRHSTTDPRTGAQRRVTYATTAAAHTRSVGNYLAGRVFHPFKGEIVEELVWVTVGARVRATLSKRTLSATAVTFPNGAPGYFTFQSRVVSETFETAAGSFQPDSPGTPLTNTVTDTQTNRCGDPITIVTTRAPGVTETTTRTYSATAATAPSCDLGPTWIDFLSLDSTVSVEGGASATREVQYVAEPDGSGRVRNTIRQPNGPGSQRVCTWVSQRDGFGNPTTVDMKSYECVYDLVGQPWDKPRRTLLTYDADGIHLASTSRQGHLTSQKVHPGLGVVYSSTDANGRVTSYQHDGFGRAVRTERPDGTNATTTYLRPGDPVFGGDLCAGSGYTNAHFAIVEASAGSDGAAAITCRDRLGRARRVATRGFGGAYSYVDTTFDSDGVAPHDRFPERVYQVSRPHANGATAFVASRAAYDAGGRVIQTCTARPDAPDQVTACTDTTYDGLTTDVCEAGNVRRRSVMTAYGTVQSTSIFPDATSCSIPGTAATTTFAYGPFDTVTSITDAAGNVVTQRFDDLGRRTHLIDRDLGVDADGNSVVSSYSVYGELLYATNALGMTTSLRYDLLGRLFSRFSGPTDRFTWDPANAKGQLASSSSDGAAKSFVYDSLGRLATSRITVDGTTYETTRTYDAQSRVATTTLPTIAGLGRLKLRNEYDVAGQLSRVELGRVSATCTATSQCQTGETCLASLGNQCGREIWRATAVDAEGRLTGERFGNGVTTTRTYLGGYLRSIATGTLQNDEYTYRDNGSLATRVNRVLNVTETFGYDGADRLKTAQVTGRPVVSYQYDALGNLTSASDVVPSAACPAGATFQYNQTTPWGAVGPHALTNLVCGSSNTALRHDGKGNHASGLAGTDAYTWTNFDKVATATSATEAWTMAYDADYQRVKKVRTSGSTTPWHTVIDVGPLERRLKATGEQDVVRIPVGSATLELVWDWSGTAGTQKLNYLHPDRLGSPVVITSATGTLVERKSFDVWGNGRNTDMVSAPPTPAATLTSFTGHTDDVGVTTGGKTFIDMGGRLYSPYLKRFWSADPFVQAPLYGPSWNRYSYTFNNPLKFTDPTGYNTASFFAPIATLGDGAGETWTVSGAIQASQSPGGELVTSWDGVKNVTFTRRGSQIHISEVTARYTIEGDESTDGLPIEVSEISERTINVGGDAPIPLCPGLQDCVQFRMLVDEATRFRRHEAGMAAAVLAIRFAYHATEIAFTFAFPMGNAVEAAPGTALVYANGGAKVAKAVVLTHQSRTRLGPTDPPQRYEGPWTISDLRRGAEGQGPLDMVPTTNARGARQCLELHHGCQMPGSGVHEVAPGAQEHLGAGMHPNRYNQGVTQDMRRSDRELHWSMRAREMGPD